MKTEAIIAASEFATRHHSGQTDKLGVPYVHHLEDVAGRVADLGEKVEIIAWLHDAVEDTSATLEEVEQHFGARVRDGVDAMTKRAGEDYFDDYLPRILKNSDAVSVKIADSSHNWGKVHLLRDIDPEKAASLDSKYRRVLELLGTSAEPVPEHLRFINESWTNLPPCEPAVF